jgi:hypothetical protein
MRNHVKNSGKLNSDINKTQKLGLFCLNLIKSLINFH